MFACLCRCRFRPFLHWKPDFQEVPTVPPFKPTNKQNRTNFEFEKDKQFIKKWVDFYEFRGFSNFERNFDFDVISEKQCLMTRASWFCPAGLRTFGNSVVRIKQINFCGPLCFFNQGWSIILSVKIVCLNKKVYLIQSLPYEAGVPPSGCLHRKM